MAYRETPFDDCVDGLYRLVFWVWVAALLVLVVETVDGSEPVADWWLAFGAATGLVGGLFTMHAYWGQRRLVRRLDETDRGPRGDRSVVEGRIASETGTVDAPVADDPAVDTTTDTAGHDSSADDSDGQTVEIGISIGSDEPPDTSSPVPTPDEGAVTRWYDVTVVEYVRKLSGPDVINDKKTQPVHEERRVADPFRVETRTETVDITGVDVSFPQGECDAITSPKMAASDGELRIPNLNEPLSSGSTLTIDASGPQMRVDSPTASLFARGVDTDEGFRGTGEYRIEGHRWVAVDGEEVYVTGEFERAPDGRLVPVGEVTVGRGRFEDRLDEERDRLGRWTLLAKIGGVAFLVGLAMLATLTVGV